MGAHKALQGINTCRVPIYYTWVERDNCGQNALSKGIRTGGIRTHDPLITSREHKPLHHSGIRFTFITAQKVDLSENHGIKTLKEIKKTDQDSVYS